MYNVVIEPELSRMLASRYTAASSWWEDMEITMNTQSPSDHYAQMYKEMQELQAEPWPAGGFGG